MAPTERTVASIEGRRRLARYLTAHGLTATDFARAFAPPVTTSAVSHWLAGRKVPSEARRAEVERLTDGAVPAGSWIPAARVARERMRAEWLARHPRQEDPRGE